MNDLFKLNTKKHNMQTRRPEKYEVLKANTEILKKSSLVSMQTLLNEDDRKLNNFSEMIKKSPS